MDNEYRFGPIFTTSLKIIEDNLCVYMVGGYIPWDDFVRLMYLTLLEEIDSKPFKRLIAEE